MTKAEFFEMLRNSSRTTGCDYSRLIECLRSSEAWRVTDPFRGPPHSYQFFASQLANHQKHGLRYLLLSLSFPQLYWIARVPPAYLGHSRALAAFAHHFKTNSSRFLRCCSKELVHLDTVRQPFLFGLRSKPLGYTMSVLEVRSILPRRPPYVSS
jgi:hypothetical protein